MWKAAAIVVSSAALVVPMGASSQSVESMPSFSVPRVGSDEPLTDSDLRGQHALVSFWSTTCGPCVAEIPHLAGAHARFGDRVHFVSISGDRDKDAIHEFRRTRYPMPWLHAWGGSGGDVFQDFGVRGTPHTILIAPTGEIVATTQELLGEELEATLARVVGEPGR